jgi:hypothetical protein
MPRRGLPSDPIAAVVEPIRELRRRADKLEQPDGNQLNRALEKVLALIDDLPDLVDDYLAGGFTTGSMTATGYIFTPAGYAYDIAYTRRAAWLGNDGRLGWASSSIDAKVLIETLPEPDVLAILDRLESHHYYRTTEIAKRKENPEYHVATEWGGIAEEFHELGLWQVVIYEWDTVWDLRDVLVDGEPVIDDEGNHLKERVPGSERRVEGAEPRPIGLHYELLGMLALVGLRQQRAAHLDLVEQLKKAGVIA